MVATTFATDTPLLVTDLVRNGGVAANWQWWALLLSGMLTVFLFARLWRRSGVLTDLEFYELRYAGRSASIVRAFRAVYLGVFFNCFVIANVTLAMVKIANVMLGWEQTQTIIVCVLLCVGFATLAGLWGVLAADIVQFTIAMVGVVVAAYYALGQPEVGGLNGLVMKLSAVESQPLRLWPDFSDPDQLFPLFLIPLLVTWWAAWYPGAEPGGGSYIAQRMLAAKNERHAVAATLWFNLAHYALRPWPWIIVALCSILVFPDLESIRTALPDIDEQLLKDDIAYPAMLTLLPAGAVGLLVASLLSAYISTMSTQLNWAASYVVHDLYRRFIRPDATERHYVMVGRVATAGLMVLGAALVPLIESAAVGFKLLLTIGAGTGLIYLLRWYWWRINAWSEITAMIASFVVAAPLFLYNQSQPPEAQLSDSFVLLICVAVTTTAWVLATFLTRPPDRAMLIRFYERTRPAGPGWRAVAADASLAPPEQSIARGLAGWALGCGMVYTVLLGTGYALYGNWPIALICAAIAILCTTGVVIVGRQLFWRDRQPA
jgi:Na+/proline symporter